tara:strand:+ start:453 stop:659 length:207 start_codon:yes stop_codon:yes gene_type:complete
MLKKILSLVLNSRKEREDLVNTTPSPKSNTPWVEGGGDPNDWMYGMINDAQKRKAKQIDDYIFGDYEE